MGLGPHPLTPPPQSGQHRRPGFDPGNESPQLKVLVRGMIGLIGIGVRHGEGGDAQNLGKDVVGQAAAQRGHKQRLGPLGVDDALAEGLGVDRFDRGFARLHAALIDDLDLGRMPRDMGLDPLKNVGGAHGLDQPDVALGDGG